jgi:hypothetical protein
MTSSILSLVVSITPLICMFGLMGMIFKIAFLGFIGRG